jgi:hypothetical protein
MTPPRRKRGGANKREQVKAAPAKIGRPPTPVDWLMIDKLCAIHCTLAEISYITDMPLASLEYVIRRDFSMSFREYFLKKSARGKMSLRRAQYEQAVGRPIVYDSKGRRVQSEVRPTPDMQKWLGIQWLNQTLTGMPDPDAEQENFDDDDSAVTPAALPDDPIVR